MVRFSAAQRRLLADKLPRGTTIVTGIYVMLGGMVLFASIVGILDLIGRHHRHREQKH